MNAKKSRIIRESNETMGRLTILAAGFARAVEDISGIRASLEKNLRLIMEESEVTDIMNRISCDPKTGLYMAIGRIQEKVRALAVGKLPESSGGKNDGCRE